MLVNKGLLHAFSQGRQVASLLEALDGSLTARSKVYMPPRKSANDDGDDSCHDGQHDVVDGHEGLDGRVLDCDLAPDPGGRSHKGAYAKQGRIDEEEQEGLVVAQADAGGEPGTVVIHL